MESEDSPTRVEGTRVNEYRAAPDGDGLVREESFESDALVDAYAVDSLGTDEAHVPQAVLDRMEDPPEPGTVRRHEDVAVVGRLDECDADERRRYDAAADRLPLVPKPLYLYKGTGLFDGCAAPEQLVERTAPVNVAFGPRLGDSATVEGTMEARGWGKEYPASDRYVVVDGVCRVQDRHVAKDIGLGGPAQWHLRTWDLPDDPSLSVTGGVHRDPVDHGLVGPTDWSFAAGRAELTNDWTAWDYDHQSIEVGNGETFESSEGVLDAIF